MCFQMCFKNVECRRDPNMKGQTVPKFGPTITKARSPLFFSLEATSADLRVLFGVFLVKRSERYDGANPFRDLNTSNNILKSILQRSGSQCHLVAICLWDMFYFFKDWICSQLTLDTDYKAWEEIICQQASSIYWDGTMIIFYLFSKK